MHDVQVLASKDNEPADEAWRAEVERVRDGLYEGRTIADGDRLTAVLDLVNHAYAHHGAALQNLERDLIWASRVSDERFEKVDEVNQRQQLALDALGDRVVTLEGDLDDTTRANVKRRLDELETWLGALDERFRNMPPEQVRLLSERLSKLEEHDADQHRINERLETRVTKLNAWSSEVNERPHVLDEKRPSRGSPEELDLLREIRALAATYCREQDPFPDRPDDHEALIKALQLYHKEYLP